MALNPGFITELTDRVSKVLPREIRSLSTDVEAAVRDAIQEALARLELVTREDFDAQTAVLQRTRNKLEHLERRMAELEAREGIQTNPPNHKT